VTETLKKLPTRRGDYYLPQFDLWPRRGERPEGAGVLEPGATVSLLGSCFAREARHYLRRRGYRARLYPAGYAYNADTIRIELEHLLEGKDWPADFVLDGGDVLYHRYRKKCVGKTREELLEQDAKISERARFHLEKAKLIVVLIGTTAEVWRDEDGQPTNEIPPPPSYEQNGWHIDPGELDALRGQIRDIQHLLKKHTEAHTAFAVCPIPLYATWLDQGILEANGRSKALLRTALDLELDEDSTYLPLWDWMQGQTGRGSVMKRDGRHFDQVGIDRIMYFAEQMLSSEPVPKLSLRHRLRSRIADRWERLRRK
jgi:hypothetical protein